jgi:hypothetical protein
MVARERELISSEDFDMYCQEAKSDGYAGNSPNFDFTRRTPLSAAERFPEAAEHKGVSDSFNEIGEAGPKSSGLIRPGFTILVIGIFVAFFQYNRTYHSSFAQHTRFLDVGMGIIIAAAGLVILLFGIWKHFRKE